MVAGSGSAPLPFPPSSASADPAPLAALPFSRRELFSDERGRGLRASWHPERGVVVLSFWNGDVCAGTVRLGLDDAQRLAAFLGADPAPADAPAQGADATVPLQVLRRD